MKAIEEKFLKASESGLVKEEFCKYCQKKKNTIETPVRHIKGDRDSYYREVIAPSQICLDCYKKIKIDRVQSKIKEIIPFKYHEIDSDRQDSLLKYFNESVYIHGPVGTGKTVFMSSLAKKYIIQGESVKWISFPAFIMRLQSMYQKDASKQETPFDFAEEIAHTNGVLCVDDLGAEKLTDYVKQILYFIINEREQLVLKTIITSNFGLKELDEQIDSRISSRIAGMCKILNLVGKDRRFLRENV